MGTPLRRPLVRESRFDPNSFTGIAMTPPGPVVSAQWLRENLDNPSIRIVDATLHLPDTGRDARAEYLAEHIPGAVFFDYARVADPDNPLPRKFPPAQRFADEVGALGIDNGTHVVAYDTLGLYSAARAWWLFRQYGYDNVSILDGGLKQWKASGFPVQAGEVNVARKTFVPGRATRPAGALVRREAGIRGACADSRRAHTRALRRYGTGPLSRHASRAHPQQQQSVLGEPARSAVAQSCCPRTSFVSASSRPASRSTSRSR
jgi:rhodanese-related sulfurtransferase